MSAPLLTLGDLGARFARRPESVLDLADDIATRFAALGDAHVPAPLGAAARNLLARCPDPSALPLWGVPYVVGANIDVAGLPTSAGLPSLDFLPDFDAVLVERVRAAGALLVGKVPADPLDLGAPALGSAEAVIAGLAAFGIESDRAGIAGRGVVEVRPTSMSISVVGLFGVASEFDGVVIHAVDVAGGAAVREIAGRSGAAGIGTSERLAQLGLLGGDKSSMARDIGERLGLMTVAVDEAPFAEASALMEDDIWLSQRLDDVVTAFVELPDLFPPRCRRRLSLALGCPARQLVQAQRRLSTLRRQVEAAFSDIDLLFVPRAFGSASFVNACGLAAIVLPDGGALVGVGGDDDRLAAAAALIVPNPSRSTRPIDILASSPLALR